MIFLAVQSQKKAVLVQSSVLGNIFVFVFLGIILLLRHRNQSNFYCVPLSTKGRLDVSPKF